MRVFAYIDPGTTGLIAQFAAAGLTGVVFYFRSRFGKAKDEGEPEAAAPGLASSPEADTANDRT